MIWLVSRLRHDFANWDRATRLAFVIGVVLFVLAIIIAIVAPPEQRLPLLIGAALLLIVLEATILWGNRGMVTVYTRAQRLYVEGDLAGARDLLEAVHPKANARVLTLLGNTYRQLGDLDQSEAVLSEAVNKAPKHYFSYYGFGRTLLAEGRYAEAAEMIRRALELGAPPVVQIDLAEVYYRLNQREDALTALRNADTNELPRALMVSYLRYRLDNAPPPAPELVTEGVVYWQAMAERFRATPYGQALQLDVREMLKSRDIKRMRRKGGISVVRVAVIAAIVGFVLIAGAGITYFSDQAAARSPLDIPAYPKAVYWGTKNVQTTSRDVYYRAPDTPEAVANYYQQQMNQHYGNSDQTCVRLPATGNAPGSDTNPAIAPYLFRCIFDNSGLNTFQYTQVDIYPGEANSDPFLNAAGMTVVHYIEQWQS